MKVVAKCSIYVGAVRHAPGGEPFEVDDTEGEVLVLRGFAAEYVEPAEKAAKAPKPAKAAE